MHPSGIVPDQIINDFVVENLRIEKLGFVEINEFILERSVESLAMGVHLGSFGVSMEMNEMQFF